MHIGKLACDARRRAGARSSFDARFAEFRWTAVKMAPVGAPRGR